MSQKRIIALVDASAYAASVCDYAGWAANRASAHVHALHVLGRREAGTKDYSGSIGLGARTELLEQLADLDAQKAKLAVERGRAILADAKQRIEADGAPDVTTGLRHGDLIETLVEAEADFDLIMIGKRGEAADFSSGHLGSNFERLVRSVHKPVFVANRTFTPPQRFVIAFDGGRSAMKAVDHVARSPMLAGLDGRLLHVGEDTSDILRKLGDAKDLLKAGGFDAEAIALPGEPEAVLAKYVEAEAADLLVMGAYGHSRIRSMIIGSTTTAMIRSCKCPVLLYR